MKEKLVPTSNLSRPGSVYGHLVVESRFLHEDISVSLWHHYNCCPPYLRCSIVVSLMVAVSNSVIVFCCSGSCTWSWTCHSIIPSPWSWFYPTIIHTLWHLYIDILVCYWNLQHLWWDLKVTKLSYWEPHNLHSWKGIKTSVNLTTVVTIDLRCCLNNSMLCSLQRWWRVLRTV